MRITWIVLDDITPGLRNSSTYSRASLVAPYMPDTTICSTIEFVKSCDVVIYQDRFEPHDLYLAEELVKAGRVVLVDISFPAWNPNFPTCNHDKIGYFRRLARLSSCIIIPVNSYRADLEHYVKNKPIKVIPNRLDLGLRVGRYELNRLGGLKELDVRQSARDYMALISTITKGRIVQRVEQEIERKIFSVSKVPRLHDNLTLSSQERSEELKKKSKILLLVERRNK